VSTKKEWSIEEKLAVVLEGFKGRVVVEICREYGISDGLYYKWRNEAIEGLKSGLKDKRSKAHRDNSPEIERNRLLKLIGEQQLIIDLQKKISREL
jgi:transposase